MNIAVDILKKMEINYAVFLSDTDTILEINQASAYVKIASSKNIMSSFWNIHQFAFHIASPDKVSHKRAFVLKKLGEIQDFVQHFILKHKLYKINKMSDYTWLIFDDEINLAIPYNCEFIRVKKIDLDSYELTEIYTFKQKIFVSNFGNWNFNSGLKIQDSSMYQRRSNLNGSIFNSVNLDTSSELPEVCFFVPYFS